MKAILFTKEKRIINELEEVGLTVNFHGSEALIDVSPNGISKWAGYQRLQSGVPFIMFGNDTNDLSMFEQGTQNFVVGSLLTGVRKANYIRESSLSQAILSLINKKSDD